MASGNDSMNLLLWDNYICIPHLYIYIYCQISIFLTICVKLVTAASNSNNFYAVNQLTRIIGSIRVFIFFLSVCVDR